MNRETKRMMQRQGQLDDEGSPAVATRRQPPPRSTARMGERPSPLHFFSEVRTELRRVAWGSRQEVTKYSLVVLFALIFLIGLIWLLDALFGEAARILFQ